MLSYPVVLRSLPSSHVLDFLQSQLVRYLLLTNVEYFVANTEGLSDAIIPMLRLIFTRGDFAKARWSNGRFSIPFCVISAIWNSTFNSTYCFSQMILIPRLQPSFYVSSCRPTASPSKLRPSTLHVLFSSPLYVAICKMLKS